MANVGIPKGGGIKANYKHSIFEYSTFKIVFARVVKEKLLDIRIPILRTVEDKKVITEVNREGKEGDL